MRRIGLLTLLMGIVVAGLGVGIGAQAQGASASGVRHATTSAVHAPTPVVNLSDQQLAAAGAPACPYNYLCEAIPCPTPDTCGVVEAGPISNLGPDQFVFVHIYGAQANLTAQVYYCRDLGSLAKPPVCPLSASQLLQSPTLTLVTMADGTSSYSYQVVEADPGGTALAGQVPNDPQAVTPFFCSNDGTANCSIDIVFPSLNQTIEPVPNATDTLVVPVAFRNLGTACSSAQQATTESEFGFQELFQSTDAVNCKALGSSASIPFNSEINGLSALQQLASGGIQIAFSDDPDSSSQMAILQKQGFLAIPLGLSANVIASRTEMEGAPGVVPQPTLELTANMAAGLVTGYYAQAGAADVVPCGRFNCPMLSFLNYNAGFSFANFLAGFTRNDTSGTTDQLLNYLCKTPAADLSVAIGSLTLQGTEPLTGEQVLKDGLYPAGLAPKGCVLTDQLPPHEQLNNTSSSFSTVDQQALKMSQFVVNPGSTNVPYGGYANMNWAVAEYYGMQIPALQNEAGAFVAPTADSLLAGLNDGHWDDKTGVWTASYTNTTDKAAYAMPTVMYAVVPRNLISASDKQQIQTTLTQLTNVIDDPTAHLAPGVLPLPANIQAVTKDMIANGVDNPTYTADFYPNGSSSASSSGSSLGSSSSSSFGSGLYSSSFGSTTGAGASAHAKAKAPPTPSSSPTYGPIMLTASEGRMVLPLTVGTGLLLLLIGGIMMGSTLLRRRVVPVKSEDVLDDAAPGDGG